MNPNLPVYIGDDALPHLVSFCQERGIDRTLLVADPNTYAALGQRVERALAAGGVEVKTLVFAGQEVIPNEQRIVEVLLQAGATPWTYLAVGSGTITDIVRFVSHRTRTSFVSLPTAPSVDGFTSLSASLTFGKWKQTVPAQPPVAVFADEATLRAAPPAMIAAGFGDMLGKYTSLADWRLAGLLAGVSYDERIAAHMRAALESCVRQAAGIGRAEGPGICRLIEGLVESGLAMIEAGTSQVAGGSEHHLSHYWEMKLLKEGRPPIFHGAKVGVATTLVARRYEAVRNMPRDEAAARLAAFPRPDRATEETKIREALGWLAEPAIEEQAPFLDMAEADFGRLRDRILTAWPEIQQIAASVPPPGRLAGLLAQVGGPTNPRALGLNDEEVAVAWHHAHYLRSRFTMLKLAYYLGI